jgi:hypothetical protein
MNPTGFWQYPLLAQNEHADAVVGCPLLRDEPTKIQFSHGEGVLPLHLATEREGAKFTEQLAFCRPIVLLQDHS